MGNDLKSYNVNDALVTQQIWEANHSMQMPDPIFPKLSDHLQSVSVKWMKNLQTQGP